MFTTNNSVNVSGLECNLQRKTKPWQPKIVRGDPSPRKLWDWNPPMQEQQECVCVNLLKSRYIYFLSQ